jgi:hypothetical protein
MKCRPTPFFVREQLVVALSALRAGMTPGGVHEVLAAGWNKTLARSTVKKAVAIIKKEGAGSPIP